MANSLVVYDVLGILNWIRLFLGAAEDSSRAREAAATSFATCTNKIDYENDGEDSKSMGFSYASTWPGLCKIKK